MNNDDRSKRSNYCDNKGAKAIVVQLVGWNLKKNEEREEEDLEIQKEERD